MFKNHLFAHDDRTELTVVADQHELTNTTHNRNQNFGLRRLKIQKSEAYSKFYLYANFKIIY